MANIMKMTFSYCRSNAYLMIGIFLGLSLSLLFAPNDIDDCSDCEELSWAQKTTFLPSIDEYEPKINVEGRPRRAQKTPKAFVRPRYYSTELGIRDKVFVGVITGREYLHSRGIALNKTLAHLVDRVRYFISVPEGAKPNVTLPGIVGFTDTRGILKPFHVMKYITDNYLEDYDYYYIVKDASYVNGRRLSELVEKISVSQDVHLGVNVANESYCTLAHGIHLRQSSEQKKQSCHDVRFKQLNSNDLISTLVLYQDAGILLSNSIVKELKTSLDWCVKNTFSSSDDVNFGRCILQASNVPCTSEIQGRQFRALKLPMVFDFDDDFGKLTSQERLSNLISVYPVHDHRTIYKFNAFVATRQLREIEHEINTIRRLILDSSHLAPENSRNVSWPVGNQPGNRANGRFDLLPWIYFNETHSFMDTDFENVRESVGSNRHDLRIILKSTADRIEREYENEVVYQRLINGYRKFDASRGMDYILDLEFSRITNGERIVKRIQVCKPLGKVEILPVPYVTENSRINMILVVESSERRKIESLDFLERYRSSCMEKKDKTFLMLVLLYEPDSPSKGTSDIFHDVKRRALELTDKYKKDQSKVTWLSVRLPYPSAEVQNDPMLKIAVADLVTKKFTPESLLLFVETRMDLKIDYLNRVRMNTISQWQIYSPIPFVEYNPDVSQQSEYSNKRSPADLDINRNAGRYDHMNYESISFYVKDYLAMRRRTSVEIPQVRTDKEISTLFELSRRNVVESLFDLFVAFTDVHALRAVEPALKILYADFTCDGTYSEKARKICERRRYLHLGHRGQLAKLILDYHNDR